MKRLVFAVALIVLGSLHHVAYAEADPPVECFSSPDAVHEAHPGSRAVYTTRATWWTESSKCWFVGETTTPKTKPRATAAVPPVRSQRIAQTLPSQPRQEAKAPNEEKAVVRGTHEENVSVLRALMLDYVPALRALMLGPDESKTDFEGRFSVIYYKAPR